MIEVHTNNVPRLLEYFWDYPPKVQEYLKQEYDWIPESELPDREWFTYKGEIYCLDDFMDLHNRFYEPNPPIEFKGWNGYLSFGYVGGLLIKWPLQYDNEIDTDHIIVGWY